MTKSTGHILIIAGPTASGKSALALSVAEKSGGVIINADSQQMYRDLRILTARPTPEDEARAPHKLYGILPADESPSAGKWLKLARMEIDWARSQGKLPIVTGGTGLYLKSLMQGIAEIPDVPPEIRRQSAGDYDAMGKDAFVARLREVDPKFFARLKVYDRQRLVRAWEVWLATGKSLSWWQQQDTAPPYPAESFKTVKVDLPREELYRRCDARFVKMVEMGVVEEVMEWWSNGVMESGSQGAPHHPTTPLGLTELTAHLRGEIPLGEAIAKAQQATRNYAKRQLTWFKNQLGGAEPVTSLFSAERP